MREFGNENIDKLEYQIHELEKVLEDGSEYPFFLVAIGEKNGAVTMNISESQIEVLEEFCDDFDLEYRVGEGRVSKPSRETVEKKERNQKAFFISKEKAHFDLLEQGRFYGYSDRSVGEFLEFPVQSIDFFIENDQPAMKSRKRISEMKDDIFSKSDLRYLNLITFIPAPQREEIREAVKKGRERVVKLLEFDEEHESGLGERFLEKRMSNNLYR